MEKEVYKEINGKNVLVYGMDIIGIEAWFDYLNWYLTP